MATRILSMKIDHIAGVNSPANKRTFLVVKSADESTDSSSYGDSIIKSAELSGKTLEQYLTKNPVAYKLYKREVTLNALTTLK